VTPGTRDPRDKVALFVTCLVDQFRPGVAQAAVRLLEDAGYEVVVPAQGCCGQPNFNSGDRDGARRMARRVIDTFEHCAWVVVPSGSCAATIKHDYPRLFDDDTALAQRASALAARTWELVTFLDEVAGLGHVASTCEAKATYHDSCSGLRELGIKRAPRAALGRVAGLDLVESRDPEACCGFGGLFCIKYPDVSNRMTERKIDDITTSGASIVVGGDVGCLMTIEGVLRRRGSRVRCRHVAEVLAGTATADDDAHD
jgi:L-lactate dehydrogenase complex protein LldE